MKPATRAFLNPLYEGIGDGISSLGFQKKRKDLFVLDHGDGGFAQIWINHHAKSAGDFIMAKFDMSLSVGSKKLGERLFDITGRQGRRDEHCAFRWLGELRTDDPSHGWYFACDRKYTAKERKLARDLKTYIGKKEHAKGLAAIQLTLANQGMAWIRKTKTLAKLRKECEKEWCDIRVPLLLELEGRKKEAVDWVRKHAPEFELYAQKRPHLHNALEDFLRLKKVYGIK